MVGTLDTLQSTPFSMLMKAGDGDLMINSLPLLGDFINMNLNSNAQHFLLLAVKVYY